LKTHPRANGEGLGNFAIRQIRHSNAKWALASFQAASRLLNVLESATFAGLKIRNAAIQEANAVNPT
jgi:hypothetical protein